MRLPNFPIFGQSNSQVVVQGSYLGQSNWFVVPPGFAIWQDANGCRWASPNGQNGEPKYVCVLNPDGQMLFQDLLRSATNDTLNSD
jgi:hypothetical protein